MTGPTLDAVLLAGGSAALAWLGTGQEDRGCAGLTAARRPEDNKGDSKDTEKGAGKQDLDLGAVRELELPSLGHGRLRGDLAMPCTSLKRGCSEEVLVPSPRGQVAGHEETASRCSRGG